VPVNSRIPSRPNERCGLPATVLPLQSVKNQTGCLSLLPGTGKTLMVLSRLTKYSDNKLEHNWFCSSLVTVA
jgi:hypothetical protein